MDAITKDKRFAQIANDARFHKMKRKDRLVTIDKRFHGMFKDKSFKLKYTVDKRGRPVRTTTNDHLQNYYDLSGSETESSDESEEESQKLKGKNKHKTKSVDKKKEYTSVDGQKKKQVKESLEDMPDEEDEGEGEEEDMPDESEKQDHEEIEKDVRDPAHGQGEQESSTDESEDKSAGLDLARGEGNEETSSSSSDDSDEEFQDDKFDHKWGELHYTAPVAQDVTARLAVCNLDWDRIKAQDIFMLLNSFKPTGGVIKSVSVYPSEFGKERMAEEDVKGPKELVERVAGEEDYEEGSEMQREKMRQYQLNRLRYYYGVIVCDTPTTANAIYEECDGIEYESTATRLDLRFIPDDMEFNDPPLSEATSVPNLATYKPKQFVNTALQQSKVELTWDETDKDRVAVTMRKFTKDDLEQLDMNEYLASSESDNDEDPYAGFIDQSEFGYAGQEESEEKVLEQYNQMIKKKGEGKKKKKKDDVDIEITWDPDVTNAAEDKLKQKAAGQATPWEQYINKKKNKKKSDRNKKRAEKKAGMEMIKEPEKEGTAEVISPNPKHLKRSETKTMDEDIADASHSDVEDVAVEEQQAFSDDELPSDLDLTDNFFKDTAEQVIQGPSTNRKKKKRGKNEPSEDSKKKEAELEMLMMDEDDDRQHFNLKAIMENEGTNLSKTKKKKLQKMKKKREKEGKAKQVEDTFNVDVTDSRFDDIYKNPLFNIDPSAPEFKATKATDALIQEKQRRIRQSTTFTVTNKSSKRLLEEHTTGVPAKLSKTENINENISKPSRDLALASLVKSVKAKTQSLKQKKRR